MSDEEEELAHITIREEVENYLAEYTLEGRWDKVIKMYYKFPQSHTSKISDSVGTALHVAIDLDEEDVVRELVNAIITVESPHQRPRIRTLEMENERGDTPLHVAASRGFAKICWCIIGMNKERIYLLSRKNNKGETPLFLAAANWRKQAFAYLAEISRDDVTLQDLVRNNGDTILHSAIRREYFDLAVIIVHYYDFLSTHANKKEATPLKVLATRPSAFKSASSFSWWKRILYHCILVEPLDPERALKSNLMKMEQYIGSGEMDLPQNYTTLYHFFNFFSKSFSLVAFGKMFQEKYHHHDPERQLNNEENKNKMNEGRRHHPFRLSKNHSLGFLPPNNETFQQFVRSAYVHTLGLSGAGLKEVKKTKKKHQWSGQLLKALMKRPYAAFTGSGGRPTDTEIEADMCKVYRRFKQGIEEESSQTDDEKKMPTNQDDETKLGDHNKKEVDKKETAFLVAARNGIVEMVMEILSKIPSAIHNTNSKKENVLLVAVANRQPLVVETLRMKLRSKPELWNNLILGVDTDENTILHLAAHALSGEKPWQIAGSALQMMWDIKWFQYIKSLVPQAFYFRSNKNYQTAGEIFTESHKDLVKDSSEWLKDTSESCSVVAALVAGVSFATASTVPGGNNEQGEPTLEGKPAFDAFAIASLVGLCFSVTGLVMFLSILTSRKQVKDFRRDLPLKLLLGLSSLFVSIAAMLVSFCTGHFFLLNHKYKSVMFPIYGVSSLPVTFYAVAQFPLYFDLLIAILTKVPHASDKFERL